MSNNELKEYIREVPDFPKPGILFYDITTLLSNPVGFKKSIDILVDRYKNKGVDKIVGIDARGFIFGAALAYKLGIGFVPIRKKGKLPWKTVSASYELEYGSDTIEMHEDALLPNEKVVIIDDLLATGGTMSAAVELVKKQKANIVECAFAIELDFLNGKKRLGDVPVFSLLNYNF